ncbi:MAG: hypothetical protein ACRETG_02545 [Steroidobacteraceae bacterium]
MIGIIGGTGLYAMHGLHGLRAHQVSTPSAHPVCAQTAALIARVARSLGLALHEDRTYACVEGPRLGTRAESLFLRSAGADVVGMTNVPEAFLALEAQLGHCTIALATDYDATIAMFRFGRANARASSRTAHPARACRRGTRRASPASRGYPM